MFNILWDIAVDTASKIGIEVITGNGTIICYVPQKYASKPKYKIVIKIRNILRKLNKADNSIFDIIIVNNDTDVQFIVLKHTQKIRSLKRVQSDGHLIKHIPPELKSDFEIVLAAVKSYGCGLKCVSDELRDNKKIVIAAVKQNANALQFASYRLKNSKQVIIASGGWYDSLKFASIKIRDNKKIMLKVVSQRGEAIKYVSDRLKKDKDIILAAVEKWSGCLTCVSHELLTDFNFIKSVAKRNGLSIKFMSPSYRSHPEIALTAVTQNGDALRFTSKYIKNKSDIVMAAVKQNGMSLKHASLGCKNNKKIVLAAINQRELAFKYASETLRNDKEIRKVFSKSKPYIQS
jgi:hypothetical protein